jgi:uncharacterized Zn-finger protein
LSNASPPQQGIENRARELDIDVHDLPLHCPMPSMVLWNAHPRVFLPIEQTGEAQCPYCGTRYRLKGGPLRGGH